jgi:cytochrome c biogenesis protein CcmG, thiol:disulfide interchange protein DsbE
MAPPHLTARLVALAHNFMGFFTKFLMDSLTTLTASMTFMGNFPKLKTKAQALLNTMAPTHLMKSLLFSSALALSALMTSPAMAVSVGDKAPALDLPGAQGQIQLDAYKGKTVYLDFWASWCGPCKQSFPWMNEMHKRYRAKGLHIVGVNLDQKPQDAQTFLATNPASFEIAFDPAGQTPRTFGVKGMPTSFLISPEGKVLMVHQGFNEEGRADLEKQIQQALKP